MPPTPVSPPLVSACCPLFDCVETVYFYGRRQSLKAGTDSARSWRDSTYHHVRIAAARSSDPVTSLATQIVHILAAQRPGRIVVLCSGLGADSLHRRDRVLRLFRREAYRDCRPACVAKRTRPREPA